MTLIAKIKSDYLAARKAHKKLDIALLSTLIGEVEMIGKNAGREVTDAEVVARVKKFLDGIESTIKFCTDQGNVDALAVVVAEKEILAAYMPRQMDETMLKEVLCELVTNVGPDLGKLMAALKSRYAGQYDGKMASTIAKTVI